MKNKSLLRKIGYIAAIALLFVPLSTLSLPATLTQVQEEGKAPRWQGSPGGLLARMRTEHGLAQAELGQIDPASATMKFATLGMRPVAVTWLWHKAHEYKKIKDWDKLEATVEQIIRLQPNDLEVWDFQAHNLSYNVSVEFDDYRYRYMWVKNGIEFLVQGTKYNREEPGLLNQIGWFTGQKIGRSDEAKQFRRLFRDDKEFHQVFYAAGVDVDETRAKGYDNKPDNWLVAGMWYDRSVDANVKGGRPIRGKTPLLFYSGGPMSLINGAAAIEKDGHFGERAKTAWEEAARVWYGGGEDSVELRNVTVYGNRLVPTSGGFDIRLNDGEEVDKRIKALNEELDQLAPGAREKIVAGKRAALPEASQKLLEIPVEKRTGEQYSQAQTLEQQTAASHEEVARTVSGVNRVRALQVADQLENEEKNARYIKIYRGIVNFDYWRQRCQAEREQRMLTARQQVFDADRQLELGQNFTKIEQDYEKAWHAFAEIFKDYPELMPNPESEELVESVERYRDLLAQLDKPFPVDFILNDMLDKHQRGKKLREMAKQVSEATSDSPMEKVPDPKEIKPVTPDAKTEPKKSEEPKPPAPKPDEPKSADEKDKTEKKSADK
jgi:hypothetical protein